MPTVGSSRISVFTPDISQRPSSTFCWLPPESAQIGSFDLPFTFRSAITLWASFSSDRRWTKSPPVRKRPRLGSERFAATSKS
jgi:hypothetical protein